VRSVLTMALLCLATPAFARPPQDMLASGVVALPARRAPAPPPVTYYAPPVTYYAPAPMPTYYYAPAPRYYSYAPAGVVCGANGCYRVGSR
jgi:hypothetical protein